VANNFFEDHARARMLQGVDKLADAVAVTMGPTGRNVIIDKSFGGPTVTKDGVTVAKEIELEDRFENMGAKLVNEVAQKTSDLAGDGTTTATVLARPSSRKGCGTSSPAAIRWRSAAASSGPWSRLRGKLTTMAKPVTSKEEVAHVGAISANNDMVIGRLLADALERVGKDGVITVEEGKTARPKSSTSTGCSSTRATSRPTSSTAPRRWTACWRTLGPAVREEDQQHPRPDSDSGKDGQTGKPLLIIAEDVDGEALTLLVVNKLRGTCSTSAPSRLPASATAARRCSATSRR
jgi:chaperonin GroEL